MITELKAAIATRLNTFSDRARVFTDDTEGEAGTVNQVKSDYILRVGYAGGTFEPPTNKEAPTPQIGDRSFQVSIEIRDFRNEDKAVQLLDDIEQSIVGFCPCVSGVFGGFYLESDRFQKNENGVYFYVLTFGIGCFLLKR